MKFWYGCLSLFTQVTKITFKRVVGDVQWHTFKESMSCQISNGVVIGMAQAVVPGLKGWDRMDCIGMLSSRVVQRECI